MNAEFADSKIEEHYRTLIEKVMLQLPPETPETHRHFLAGYIDSWADMGHISESVREILYSEYAL